ncbi:hypothetical protein GF336_07370 [Candidatus Woesearchaeota archaeon]|nr:hypothetical protein [Candidatus Woesearchaeota archaeon]
MKAQIQEGDAKCVICQEAITNPTCPECLGTEVITWLKERIPSLADEITWPAFGCKTGVNCIKCGKEMGICAHCYTREIYGYFRDLTPILANDFAETFDFGLREEIFN